MRRVIPLLATSAALLSGCVDLAPDYHRPAPPTPAHFANSGPDDSPAMSPQPMSGWRDFFPDARLRAIIALALANNRDLRVAIANIEAARSLYRIQAASRLPTVGVEATATYGQTPTSVLFGRETSSGAAKFQNEHVYGLMGGVSAFELDLFNKKTNLTRAAYDRYLATREARDAAQIAIVSEVATDYVAIGADRALLKIAQDTLMNGNGTVDVARRRLEFGAGSQLDVSQAQTFAQTARFDVARLTAQVAQDRNALELLVGAPVGDDLLTTDINEPIGLLEGLPASMQSSILLSRPDILAAESRLVATNADIGAARAAFFPEITLTGSGGLSSLALSTLFDGGASAWALAPAVSQTLFDGGARRGNLAFARAQRDLSLAIYERAVQTAFREVADALAVRGSIDEQLAAQTALNAAANEGLATAQSRYAQGSDTYLNVLVAERTLYSARQSLTTTRRSKATNLVALYAALGGGLEGPQAVSTPSGLAREVRPIHPQVGPNAWQAARDEILPW